MWQAEAILRRRLMKRAAGWRARENEAAVLSWQALLDGELDDAVCIVVTPSRFGIPIARPE